MIARSLIASSLGLAILALAGCGGNTQKDFLCPAQEGIACATISEADVGSGNSVTPVRETFGDTLGKEMSQSPLGVGSGKGGKLTVVSQSSMGDGGAPYRAQQYRVPEEVGTLWIAPHRDADGLLYEASFVHFVVREARWASQ